jgi:hypothetical protein
MTDLATSVSPGGLLLALDPLNTFKWFQLNTHPEFNQFPAYEAQFGTAKYMAAKMWFNQGVRPMIYRQRLKTWAPRMACVRAEPGSSLDKGWVLAVPCGTLSLEAEEIPSPANGTLTATGYQRLDQFFPGASTSFFPHGSNAVFADHFEEGLIQFFDFTNPQDVIDAQAGDIPSTSSNLPMVFLPNPAVQSPHPNDVAPSSMAWHLENYEWSDSAAGYERSYIVVGDFMGAVHIYEITDLLQPTGNAPILRASWYPPAPKQDLLMSNIRDIEIDVQPDGVVIYAAVQRRGVVVFKAMMSPGGAVSLMEDSVIDDIQEPLSLHLRKLADGSGERLLYVCDHRQALRVYTSL